MAAVGAVAGVWALGGRVQEVGHHLLVHHQMVEDWSWKGDCGDPQTAAPPAGQLSGD